MNACLWIARRIHFISDPNYFLLLIWNYYYSWSRIFFLIQTYTLYRIKDYCLFLIQDYSLFLISLYSFFKTQDYPLFLTKDYFYFWSKIIFLIKVYSFFRIEDYSLFNILSWSNIITYFYPRQVFISDPSLFLI